ncbi:hypothetical protein JXO59_16605, partial [candidate division KSB1 bacterium]|nr:hypothetical protein [candidate division KSB1 bacterium]
AVKKYQPCKRCKPPVLNAARGKSTAPDSSRLKSTEKKQQSNRCQAITKKGTRCKRKALPGSKYCRQHQPR